MKKIILILILLVVSPLVAQKQKEFNFEGFDAKADAYINAIKNVGEFSGTILVAHKGNIKYHKGFGMASRRFNIPNSVDTKFRVGSVTKSFTAIGILKLVEQGKLSLDDKLSKFHKDFPFANKIQIKHLLSHTSGLKRDIKFPDKTKKYKLDELIKMSEVDSLLYNPGTKMSYSNCGYVLLQSILEQLTGADYETYITAEVLHPLGLYNTGVEDPLLPPMGLADGFNSGKDKNGNYSIIESHMSSHGYPDAVGAMYSTTEDMMKFSRLIGKSNILSKESWKKALTPFLDSGRGYNWGFGFNIMKGKTTTVYNHNGRTSGFRCGYFQLAEDDLTVIILGNYNNAAREDIVRAFQKMLLSKEYYQPQHYEVIGSDNLNLDDFVGEYKTAEFPFKILKFKNELYVSSHGDPPAKLVPYETDAFFCKYFDLNIKFEREGGEVIGCNWNYKIQKLKAKKLE